MEKKLIIFTDIGDTIIDETTEVRKQQYGVVYSANCIPGAKETFLSLYQQGYRIVMVADGLEQSFRNTMKENGLDHVFSEWVISEQLGVEKPNALMFETAMGRMGLTDSDKKRVIMVGNNLKRDMVGANRFGILSADAKVTLSGNVRLGNAVTFVVPNAVRHAMVDRLVLDWSAAALVGPLPSTIAILDENGRDLSSMLRASVDEDGVRLSKVGLILILR